jgi:8-oxo-dGTP pyrophosphatase MutT (NUDIX family)
LLSNSNRKLVKLDDINSGRIPMQNNKRGKVWLGVSGLVINEAGEWLVVKKKYGGLKDKWSLPAGFVESYETADEAVVRETLEETGIHTIIKGLVGLRTGVLKNEISDNMLIFLLEPVGSKDIKVAENELYDAKFVCPDTLVQSEDCSILLQYLINTNESQVKPLINGINPGDQFGYTAYKLFL